MLFRSGEVGKGAVDAGGGEQRGVEVPGRRTVSRQVVDADGVRVNREAGGAGQRDELGEARCTAAGGPGDDAADGGADAVDEPREFLDAGGRAERAEVGAVGLLGGAAHEHDEADRVGRQTREARTDDGQDHERQPERPCRSRVSNPCWWHTVRDLPGAQRIQRRRRLLEPFQRTWCARAYLTAIAATSAQQRTLESA